MSYTTSEFIDRYEILLDSCSHYYFISSARVYADNGMNKIGIDSPRLLDICTDQDYLDTDEYALSKARQEDMLVKSNHSNWTILRPYITFGKKRLQFINYEKEDWILRALSGRKLAVPYDLLSLQTTITSSTTVAKQINLLLVQNDNQRRIFNCTSAQSCSWGELLDLIQHTFRKELGFMPKIEYISAEQTELLCPSKYQLKYDRIYNRLFHPENIYKDAQNNSELLRYQMELKFFLSDPCFSQNNVSCMAITDHILGDIWRKAQ